MRRIALGATLLLAAGCGSSNSNSSTCDNFINALNGLSGKYAACGTLNNTIPFDKNQCVDAFNHSGCTDSDKQKINDVANCLSGLPNCTPATQTTWATSFENCFNPLQTLSSNC